MTRTELKEASGISFNVLAKMGRNEFVSMESLYTARDVRKLGIPLVTYRVPGLDGRKIAAYKFGDPSEAKNILSKVSGRTVLSKALKQALVEKYGAKCFIYLETMNENILQVDHRIPYEIDDERDEEDLDASCF